jgi:hypothetical protein
LVVVDEALALAGRLGEVPDAYLIAAAVGLLAVLSLVRAAVRRRGPRPATGEIWFAQVPFEDRVGSKDRPVLVLAVTGRTCTVARFTSQDRSARRDHRQLPGRRSGLQGTSWVNLRPMTLPRTSLRRRVARRDTALVRWYAAESGWSAGA